MSDLDSIDRKIITLLNQDGRMSSAEIERRLGNVSARTINNRIDTLVKNGIINVRAVVNPEAIGYGVMAEVFIETNPGQLREIAEKIAKLPLVSYVACATGDKDIIISVRGQNIEELYRFSTDVLGKIPGVQRTKTYFMPLNAKDLFTWLPPNILNKDEDTSL